MIRQIIFDSEYITLPINSGDMGAIGAYNPGTIPIPSGLYEIILSVKIFFFTQEVSVLEFYFDNTKMGVWTDLEFKWYTAPLDFETFTLKLKSKNDDFNDFKGWKYMIYTKRNNEPVTGKREPYEFSYNRTDCLQNIFTKGPNKLLTAVCPVGLTVCPNWKRTDQIGKLCRVLFTESDLKDSTNENPVAIPNILMLFFVFLIFFLSII